MIKRGDTVLVNKCSAHEGVKDRWVGATLTVTEVSESCIYVKENGYAWGLNELTETSENLQIHKLKCNVCGCEFYPTADKRYTVIEPKVTGLITVVSDDKRMLKDAFDCPACGCQIIAGNRLEAYNKEGKSNDSSDSCTAGNNR